MSTKEIVKNLLLNHDSYSIENKDRYIENDRVVSATALLKSPRNIIGNIRKLKGELDLDIDFSNDYIYYARMGTAVHEYIERILTSKNLPQELMSLGLSSQEISNLKFNIENRYSKEFDNNFIVTGKIDYCINGELHDIKTTSSYVYESGCKDSDYCMQASIYKLLADGEIKGDSFYIDYIIRDFKEPTKENQPQSRYEVKEYSFYPENEVTDFIDSKLKQLHEYWDKPLEEIPCCESIPVKPIIKYHFFASEKSYLEGKRPYRVFDTLEEVHQFNLDNYVSKGKSGYIVEHDSAKRFECEFCSLGKKDE